MRSATLMKAIQANTHGHVGWNVRVLTKRPTVTSQDCGDLRNTSRESRLQLQAAVEVAVEVAVSPHGQRRRLVRRGAESLHIAAVAMLLVLLVLLVLVLVLLLLLQQLLQHLRIIHIPHVPV